MADFSFKYGDGHMDFSFPDEDIIKVIEPAHVTIPEGTEERKIAEAINNPLGTGKLEEIDKTDRYSMYTCSRYDKTVGKTCSDYVCSCSMLKKSV